MVDKLQRDFIKSFAPYNQQDKTSAKVKVALKNPLNQFIILGVVLVLFQLLSIIAPSFIPSTFTDTIASIMTYCIMSIGFCLLLGYSGLASLGTAGFVGIGAYVTFYAMQQFNLPYVVAFVGAVAISILLGFIIGFISLRIEGIYLAIITLGLSEIIRYALKALYSGVVKVSAKNLKLFGIRVEVTGMYFVVCAMLILLLIITSNLINSPTGRAMIAMKSSTSAAQAYGISLLKYRMLAFIIATVYATLAGMSYLLIGNALSPSSEAETMLKLTLSLNILGAVIIGGYKSLWGTMFGTFFVFGLNKILTLILPYQIYLVVNPYMSVVIGILIILVVMFYPGGIAQLLLTWKYKRAVKKQERRLYKYGTEE